MSNFKKLFNFIEHKEQQILRQWCDDTWPGLYRYVYTLVQNREEAEDVTQETYARILIKFSSPNLPSQGYLRTAALNIIRDRWRLRKKRGVELQLEEALLISHSDLENDLSNVITRSWVEEALNKLSEDQRRVLTLRIIEGFSRTDTAKKMDRSEDAVRGLQYRAINNLREILHRRIKEENEK